MEDFKIDSISIGSLQNSMSFDSWKWGELIKALQYQVGGYQIM